MSKITITVDEGADTGFYRTNDPPTYKAVWVPGPNQVHDEPSRLVFCVFTPTNGYQKGQLMQVPFGRIISVSELT